MEILSSFKTEYLILEQTKEKTLFFAVKFKVYCFKYCPLKLICTI